MRTLRTSITRRHRRGANLIEFALLLPFFVLLMSGFIDIGWLFFQQSLNDSAVAVGCRTGALVDPGIDEANFTDVVSTVEDTTRELIVQGGGTTCSECAVTVTRFGSNPARSILCSVTRPLDPLTNLTIGSLNLESAIAVRMEWQRGDEE
ncbi:MAG: TadE family protein [Myxococcota bacterium]